MLVLARKKFESIVIGDDITIEVLEIRGDRVRLGIDAPKAVPVQRQEIWARLNGPAPEVEPDDEVCGEDDRPLRMNLGTQV